VTLPSGPSADEQDEDDGAPGFFARNRVIRLASGLVISIVLIAAYLFGIQSYRAGLNQDFPQQTPPTGGVSVVIVPEKVAADAQELPAQVLLFPAGELLDPSGLLTREIQVRIEPAVSGQVLTFPAGEGPAPQAILLPAPGIVQQYPFDSFAVSVNVSAHSVFADTEDIIPTSAAVFVRVPGWTDQGVSTSPAEGSGQHLTTALVRDGSTKSIALLLLLLMVVLATIAILVTGSATRGRMTLELSVASWMTALLFALIPIRGFFPGAPPLGSWMDILVFFWVELILMLAVAAVAATILLRARDARHHQAGIH
jgi:hypothetical protein